MRNNTKKTKPTPKHNKSHLTQCLTTFCLFTIFCLIQTPQNLHYLNELTTTEKCSRGQWYLEAGVNPPKLVAACETGIYFFNPTVTASSISNMSYASLGLAGEVKTIK